MRRLSAVSLLVLFSFSLMGPAIWAGTESRLPECCRRLGRHHCSMNQNGGQPPSSDSTLTSVSGKCPYFPPGRAVPPQGKASLRGTAQTVIALLVSHSAGLGQTEARHCVSFGRSHPKRGPPTLS